MWLFCFSGFGLFSQKNHFPFLHIKRARKYLGDLYVDPCVEWVKLKYFPRYPSNTPKYTTYNLYWIQNNLLFDLLFVWKITKRWSLKYSALFTCCSCCSFLPFHSIIIMSLGSTKLKNLSMMCQKQVQLSIAISQTIIRPLRTFSKLNKFLYVNFKGVILADWPIRKKWIHEDIIFLSQDFFRNAISPLITYSPKIWYYR